MGQTKGVAHYNRRDPDRHVLREALPKARKETVLLAIEAMLRELENPALTFSERKAAGERLHHLRLMAKAMK